MTDETPSLRIVSATGDDDDDSLRPRRLADYVGQENIKDQLSIAIARRAHVAMRLITCCSMGAGVGKDDPFADHRG